MVNFSNLDTLTIRDYHYRTPKSNEIICNNYIDEVRVGLVNVDTAWEYVSEIISDALQHIPYRFKIERHETSSHYFGLIIHQPSSHYLDEDGDYCEVNAETLVTREKFFNNPELKQMTDFLDKLNIKYKVGFGIFTYMS